MFRRTIIAALWCLAVTQAAMALTPAQQSVLLAPTVPAWVTQSGGVPASVDFNFALNQYYQSGQLNNVGGLLNVSRASAGAAVSSVGVWTQFPASAPRISDLGILVEEARTNGIRDNSMAGAVPGGALPTNWGTTPVGLSFTLSAISTENGIDYMEFTIAGTPTGSQWVMSFEKTTIIAALQNQAWTDSVFLAVLPGGTGLTNINSIKLNFNNFTSAGGFLAAHSGADIKASIPASLNTSSRFSVTATVTQATTAFVSPSILIGVTSGQAVNLTLRVGWPQLEQGAFITSPIRTVDAAVTRAADVVTLANLPTFGLAWSLLTSGTISEVSAVRSLLGTSVANNQPIYSPTSNTLADANNGSVALAATAGSGGWTTGGKAASGFSAAGRSIVMNNGTVATDANTHIAPTTLYLGGTAGTVSGVKTISRFTAWTNARLSDTALKALTQ